MAKPSTNLLWCVIQLGKDRNWWVGKISDDVNWDTDALPVVDPKQLAYILDLLDPLREYGLSTDIVESAFIPFQAQALNPDSTARIVRVNESFFESDEVLFALPDVVDEEKGPYAEFIDHITKLRVKFLNDNIEFEHKLTTDELEDQVRETQNHALADNGPLHAFQEITDILEFVPEGYELSVDEDVTAGLGTEEEEEDIDVGEGFDLDTDEKIEEDDTMRWDEEPEENEPKQARDLGMDPLDDEEEEEDERPSLHH
ncbi:MAG: hypothetical protein LBD14_05855 [Puniceicoccales bacterium]|jgi:hypothetical protein|nr:hypothetical protein [Puniceicoccales bacterium]